MRDYDPLKGFRSAPIGLIALVPANPTSSTLRCRWHNVKDLIALARKGRPADHLRRPPARFGILIISTELFGPRIADLLLTDVPYRGSVPLIPTSSGLTLPASRITHRAACLFAQSPQRVLRAHRVNRRHPPAILPEVPTVAIIGRARLLSLIHYGNGGRRP